jgi:hypothetical protein
MLKIKKIIKRAALGIAGIIGLGLILIFSLAHFANGIKKESAVAVSFTAGGAFYKPGTLGASVNRLAKVINVDVPIVLIEHSDAEYEKDFVNDPRSKIITSRISSYYSTNEKAREQNDKAHNLETYAFVPLNNLMQSMGVCPIFLTRHFEKLNISQQMPTVFHEMTHCQDVYLRRAQPAHRKVIWERVLALVPINQQDERRKAIETVFAESLPTANLRALSFVSGDIGHLAQAGFSFELKAAMTDSKANESPEVAKIMKQICARVGDCPTKLDALEEKLTSDPRYMQALKSDIERYYQISKKSQYK